MMERNRSVKALSIVALVIAIVGMSLGFAAFSATLNISSSANVTPNEDDFKVTVYGMSDETKPWYTFDSYDSLTYSIPDDGNEDNKAVINNSKDDFSIDISLTETSNFELFYNFMIINEGKYSISSYDSEINWMKSGFDKTCTNIDGVSNIDEICDNTNLSGLFYDMNGNNIISISLEPGEYVYLTLNLTFDELPDGEMRVDFDPILMEFFPTY